MKTASTPQPHRDIYLFQSNACGFQNLHTSDAFSTNIIAATRVHENAADIHHVNDDGQFPTAEEFDAIIQCYLRNLSPKKRDKALVDRHRYATIVRVLKDPRGTTVSTAQFRFWAKKMFQLRTLHNGIDIVCHDNKPVAMREQIYAILVSAHREAHHGGRDKTAALVRHRYSWIPKELIARFVLHCPFCISRRAVNQSPSMSARPRTPPDTALEPHNPMVPATMSSLGLDLKVTYPDDMPWGACPGPASATGPNYPLDTTFCTTVPAQSYSTASCVDESQYLFIQQQHQHQQQIQPKFSSLSVGPQPHVPLCSFYSDVKSAMQLESYQRRAATTVSPISTRIAPSLSSSSSPSTVSSSPSPSSHPLYFATMAHNPTVHDQQLKPNTYDFDFLAQQQCFF